MLPHYSDFPRFWSKVGIGAPNKCWPWTASKNSNGYGSFWMNGHLKKAHRVAYELVIGPIPEGLEIDHLCREHACVNTSHLEPVTHRENGLRGLSPYAKNARKTHCKRGHPFNEANTRIRVDNGTRWCHECNRLRHQTNG